jgi:DNA-binding MarR family transcriptional regulator
MQNNISENMLYTYMDASFLEQFGMTKTEAKIYLEISKLKEPQIGEIIKKTGLHRGTVYNSINHLISKGFLNYIDKNEIRHYKVNGSKIFENIIEEEKKKLEENQQKTTEFFKQIEIEKEEDGKQDVDVFTGKEIFKSLFLEMYDECKSKKIEYLFQGNGGEMMEAAGKYFYKQTQKLKKELNLKCRAMLNQDTMNLEYAKYVKGNIRFFSEGFSSPASTWVYDNTVLIVLFRTNPLITIRIRNKIAADSFRSTFENIWNSPRVIKDKINLVNSIKHMIKKGKEINVLTKSMTVPHLFYPENKKLALEYRKYKENKTDSLMGQLNLEMYKELKKKGLAGTKINYIVFSMGLNEFFKYVRKKYGDKKLKSTIKTIRNRIKKEKVEIRYCEGYNPLRMLYTDKEGELIIQNQDNTYSIGSSEEKMTKTFRMIFTQYWKHSKPIEEYLEKTSKD